MLWALLAAALAADDEVLGDEVVGGLNEEGVYEVYVWGEDAMREAQEALISKMDHLGWRQKRRANNGDLIFRGPQSWTGAARITPEGLISFSRPVVVYSSFALADASPSAEEGKVPGEPSGGASPGLSRDRPAPVLSPRFYILPSRRKLAAVHGTVLTGIQPEMTHYRAVLQETAFQETLYELPGRLDALWEGGAPLEGAQTLETPETRRGAVLDYWATRADTSHGQQVCQAVELWLSRTVQTSEHPVTAMEQEAANARRTDGRRLDLAAP
jgi:hypothetical protein